MTFCTPTGSWPLYSSIVTKISKNISTHFTETSIQTLLSPSCEWSIYLTQTLLTMSLPLYLFFLSTQVSVTAWAVLLPQSEHSPSRLEAPEPPHKQDRRAEAGRLWVSQGIWDTSTLLLRWGFTTQGFLPLSLLQWKLDLADTDFVENLDLKDTHQKI